MRVLSIFLLQKRRYSSNDEWYDMPWKGKTKMKIPDSLKRYGLAKVYDYLDKDPMNNMGKVMDLVNKFAGDTLSLQREAFDTGR